MALINLPHQKVSLRRLLKSLKEGESVCCGAWWRVTMRMVRRLRRWMVQTPTGGRSLGDESGMLIWRWQVVSTAGEDERKGDGGVMWFWYIREMKGVLPKQTAVEMDEFMCIRKGVSLGRVERPGKKELGLIRKIDGIYEEWFDSMRCRYKKLMRDKFEKLDLFQFRVIFF